MGGHNHSHVDLTAGKRITWLGIGINAVLIAFKIAGGLLGNSRALLADAVHSVSDFLSDILVLIGLEFFRKPEDELHPYGHGKIETLSTIGVGILLLVAAVRIGVSASLAIYRGTAVQPHGYTIYIAAASIILKEFMYHITVREGRKIKSEAMIANAWHHRSDALTSIVTLAGISLSVYFPALRFFDSYAALLVSFFIIKISVDILKNAIKKIIDTSPSREFLEKVYRVIRDVDGVVDCHDLTARYYADLIRMEVHVEVKPSLSVLESHVIADEVAGRIRDRFKNVSNVLVHIDPYNDSNDEKGNKE